MNGYQIHTLDTAPARSRPALEDLKEAVGFIPNGAATMAESAALVTGFVAGRAALATGGLTELERQTAALVVAFEFSCEYCMAFHSTVAARAGASEADLAALRDGHRPGDPRLAVIADVTRTLMRERGRLTDDLADGIFEAGLTRSDLLEIIAQIGSTTLVATAHNAVGGIPLDPALEAQAWGRASG